MSERTLYLIDGHSQVFKAYHAIQHLSNSKGIPTNAVYGFTQILHRLLKSRTPQYLAVVFDSGGPTFRHETYEQYKANRAEAPEDLSQQMGYIFQILDALRIPTLAREGFEADDIIATITRKATEEGYQVVIVTADKDLFQLVNDNVRVLRLDPDNEKEFDAEAVREKMGVYPDKILDLLSMMGDASDNIPGIRKIGPKTAAALLDQFGTLEKILDSTDQLKGKQREYIEADRENALLSKRLVTLDYAVPVDYTCDQFAVQQPDVQRLIPLYKELEFRRLLEDLPQAAVERKTHYRFINTVPDLEQFCRDVEQAGEFAIDTETDSLDPMTAQLVGISMSIRPDESVYIPVGHCGTMGNGIAQLTIEQIRTTLLPVLTNPKLRKLGHNLKFDRRVLLRNGLDLEPMQFDTLLGSYILNPDKRQHGLKELAQDLLGIKMTPISDLIGKGKTQITFAETELEPATQYACADADVTLQLARLLEPRLDESGMRDLYDRIELPLINVLLEMENCGVCIDPEHFRKLSGEMQRDMQRLSERIFELAGHHFNLASPKQVAQVLFEEQKLVATKKKKTGFSTDVEVLEELAEAAEIARLILEHRQIEKLRGTYVDVLPGLVNAKTGRIHTSYNQTVAATGRLSSSDPNLQNIPVRTALGREIRRGFIPSGSGNVLLSADYSQIELRVLAHVSHDPALVHAYRNNEDVHTLTASKIFGCAESDVTPEMRDKAKVVNFGIIYGMSAQGLSTRLKIPFPMAKQFIADYFAAYTGVRDWIQQTLQQARDQGFVATLAGRRRYVPDITSRNFNARSAAERYAINAPIQGTSADMIKIAMIRLHNWLKESGLRARMIMQVHDELIFDAPKDELPKLEPAVREHMQNAIEMDVPVEVELASGPNWKEC